MSTNLVPAECTECRTPGLFASGICRDCDRRLYGLDDEPCAVCGDLDELDRAGRCPICAEDLRCEAADHAWELFKDRHTEHFNCRIF